MLTQEKADEALKEFEVKDWRKRRLEGIGALPGDLKEIAKNIFDVDFGAGAYGYWEAKERKRNLALEKLQDLESEQRRKIFDVLFPKISRHVEATWKNARGGTYQMAWTRKAFRAPNNSELTLLKRQRLIVDILNTLAGYEEDIAWVAAWLPYLSFRGTDYLVAPLLASAIDGGGPEGEKVFEILVESAKGEHEIGMMGRHVASALLIASRPEGWEFVEKMLLAAQRQEGLRQVILESIDEAHPEAFKRMVRLVLENKLTRFASVARAIDVWFGFHWESKDAKTLDSLLEEVLVYLESDGERAARIENGDGKSAFLALWAEAFYDVMKALPQATAMLADKDARRRFAATCLLTQLEFGEAKKALTTALKDDDLRIVSQALAPFLSPGFVENEEPVPGLFDALEWNLGRVPDRVREQEPLLWPWCKNGVDSNLLISAMLGNMRGIPPSRLIPHLNRMGATNRIMLAHMMKERGKKLDAKSREAFVDLVGDASANVRAVAFEALAGVKITADEALRIAECLKRKPSDLRKGAIGLLAGQDDDGALNSARMLIEAGDNNRKKAGLEILKEMHAKGRAPERCRALASEYKKQNPVLATDEKAALDAILDSGAEECTGENALGLMNPDGRTKPTWPVERAPDWNFEAARNLILSLDEFVHEHRETEVEIPLPFDEERTQKALLGNLGWHFPSPNPDLTLEKDLERLPLRELWENWWNCRPDKAKDADGLEVTRAALLFGHRQLFPQDGPSWQKKLEKKIFDKSDKLKIRYDNTVIRILPWLKRMFPAENAVDFLLDSLETVLAEIPADRLCGDGSKEYSYMSDWRYQFETARTHVALLATDMSFEGREWTKQQAKRFWNLLRWIDEPLAAEKLKTGKLAELFSGKKEAPRRFRANSAVVFLAYEQGIAHEADVYDQLLGSRDENVSWGSAYRDLQDLSRKKPGAVAKRHPFVREFVDDCRERILQVERLRGDLPTPASSPALALKYTGGADVFLDFIEALGSESFARGWTYDRSSKASVFSHIVRSTYPSRDDDFDSFKKKVKGKGIKEAKLIDAAVYAPQWSRHIEATLGWESFSLAVWWIHAHTKDSRWTVDRDIKEAWSAEINAFTPLEAQDLLNGAVDVQWFEQAFEALGPDRWKRLENSAKYSSGGAGHARAKLFAEAMLGRLEKEDLKKRVEDARHQDSVRALGLLPLAKGEKRDEDLMDRYLFFQEFVRTGKNFGAQKRESEKLATKIGMENLARTAGYKDPLRMEWDLEARSVEELAGRMPSLEVDGVAVRLLVDESGAPAVVAEKNGQRLKSVPAKLKKNKEVNEIRQRAADLKRQSSRIRKSLEQSMCRGDRFTVGDLRSLARHPLLAPLTEKLLFTDGVKTGYPSKEEDSLTDFAGNLIGLEEGEELRIAHPCDLVKTGDWSKWQEECFSSKRVQPFKQVFRELYVVTESERKEGHESRRYEGHQVQSRKTAALLGARGWVLHPEEGAARTFHDEKITAWVSFLEGLFTPAEVEGLTIETVHFAKTGEWRPLNIAGVPSLVFSEVMRDVDLVVGVAHAGGVDPEASASTVEMRTALVQETCSLLGLENVEIKGNHVLIDGKLSNYSVHLGSAVVHRMPGGQLFIVPVHSRHRGRIFLPFADDDPKTAEVMSKMILLAQDDKIKDPTILEQLRSLA